MADDDIRSNTALIGEPLDSYVQRLETEAKPVDAELDVAETDQTAPIVDPTSSETLAGGHLNSFLQVLQKKVQTAAPELSDSYRIFFNYLIEKIRARGEAGISRNDLLRLERTYDGHGTTFVPTPIEEAADPKTTNPAIIALLAALHDIGATEATIISGPEDNKTARDFFALDYARAVVEKLFDEYLALQLGESHLLFHAIFQDQHGMLSFDSTNRSENFPDGRFGYQSSRSAALKYVAAIKELPELSQSLGPAIVYKKAEAKLHLMAVAYMIAAEQPAFGGAYAVWYCNKHITGEMGFKVSKITWGDEDYPIYDTSKGMQETFQWKVDSAVNSAKKELGFVDGRKK